MTIVEICCGPCNLSKWEADIWGLLEVRRSAILADSMVTLAWGNPGVARYWEMATLPAGYVLQRKVPWASSSGSLGFIRMVDSVSITISSGILSLSCSQYSQTICWHGWDNNACLGVKNTSSIGAWPNSLDWRPPWYFISSITNKQTIVGFDYQSHLAVRSGKKIPNQHPCLGNRGSLKVLNATKLVLMNRRLVWPNFCCTLLRILQGVPLG